MTDTRPDPTTSLRVLWTRGNGCADLAEMLGGDHAARLTGSIADAIVAHRADLLVARRLGHRPLISTAVPVEFDPSRIRRVIAAVGGGPHSSLATTVAARLAAALEVDPLLLSAYRNPEERPDAEATLYSLASTVPGIEATTIETRSPTDLIEHAGDGALLVIGAPGGSWLQRMFFGPGARLVSGAPTGAVVVRRAPRRAYQVMEDPIYVSPLLGTSDALRLSEADVLPVVDGGKLVGSVRRQSLLLAGDGVSVGALMGEADSVEATDSLLLAGDVAAKQGGGPVAVIDGDGRLIGTVPEASLRGGAIG